MEGDRKLCVRRKGALKERQGNKEPDVLECWHKEALYSIVTSALVNPSL